MKSAETSVSQLTKMKRRTSVLKIAAAGSTRMDEMKATWNETRMWLAMTQPSWSDEHGDVVARRTISLDLFLSPAVYRVRRVAAIAT